MLDKVIKAFQPIAWPVASIFGFLALIVYSLNIWATTADYRHAKYDCNSRGWPITVMYENGNHTCGKPEPYKGG